MLVSLLFAVNISAADGTVNVGNLEFREFDTYCMVTKCDRDASGEIKIPSTVDFGGKSLPVTGIYEYAFSECVNITGVIIPDSINTIEFNAFIYCSRLTSVTIGNGLTSIGEWAFDYCSNLEHVTIINGAICPNFRSISGYKKLHYNEFDNALYLGDEINPYNTLIKAKNTSITSVEININTKVIADDAFSGCSNLTSISIPDGVVCIGDRAFEQCGFTSIVIPDSVKSLRGGIFSFCRNLETVKLPKGITSIDSSVSYPYEQTFRQKETQGMLEGCISLKSFTIPDSVQTIGEFAFAGSGLISITVPDTVTRLGGSAFANCAYLEEINLSHSISKLESASFDPGGYKSEFQTVGAFQGCKSLKSITIPDNVKSIGAAAFCGCSSLEEVILPKGLISISSATATYTDWETDETHTSWHGTFENCENLKKITIPGSVSNIDVESFEGCDKLETAYFGGSEQQWNAITIYTGNDALLNAEIIFANSNAGDCNGDGAVDNKDVVVLFRYVSGGKKVADESAYDFNGDGAVDNKDVVALFRAVSVK